MSPANYFAYGSNMNPARMRIRGIAFYNMQRASLSGYKLVFNVREEFDEKIGYANIVRDEPSSVVEGVLYTIPQSDFAKLDAAEDAPECYKRVIVKVATDRDQVDAATYLGKRLGTELAPTKEYLSHLLIGSALLSSNYQRWLRTIKTVD